MLDVLRKNDDSGARPEHRRVHTAPAIVVGLDCITGLQTARLLAKRGVPVIGICNDRRHYCARTRVCRRIVCGPTSGDRLIETLADLGRELGQSAVLFPCSDASVFSISQHRDRLDQSYHVLLPEHHVVETLMDKLRFAEFAEQAGFPVPATRILRNQDDAEEAADTLTFPCVLKPPMKTATWESRATAKAYEVADAAQLLALYDVCREWSDVLMVQEWISGGEENLYSCNCYFGADSEPLVTFVARKIRQWPPGTGTSCLGEECRNEVVLEETLQLFRTAGYRGLGYVEMKRDVRTGRHFIIEPNVGRPTGRSAIAEAGGVELVYTAYCDALGLPLPENRRQVFGGVKWIYWRRDLQSAFHYLRRGELSIGEWWRTCRGRKACAVFSWTDLGPFWGDLRKIAMATLRSGWRRLRRRRNEANAQPNEAQGAESVAVEQRETVGQPAPHENRLTTPGRPLQYEDNRQAPLKATAGQNS